LYESKKKKVALAKYYANTMRRKQQTSPSKQPTRFLTNHRTPTFAHIVMCFEEKKQLRSECSRSK
ncbi:MAG: hypothetical protein ACRCTW_03040, partial [Lactococcus garvieae]